MYPDIQCSQVKETLIARATDAPRIQSTTPHLSTTIARPLSRAPPNTCCFRSKEEAVSLVAREAAHRQRVSERAGYAVGQRRAAQVLCGAGAAARS